MYKRQAQDIGAVDTNFETPNGLDKGEHHSTAYDMAVITCYALKNETFTDIINTRQVNIKSDRRTYTVINKNRLLNEYDGAIGVKTGFTGKAGNCFVGAAEREDVYKRQYLWKRLPEIFCMSKTAMKSFLLQALQK